MDKLCVEHPLANQSAIARPGLVVSVPAPPNLTELRGGPEFQQHPHFGCLPSEPGKTRDLGAWRACWLRPQGWLLVDTPGATRARDMFREAANGEVCRLVDLSHSHCCIHIAGTSARELLACGTPLDLRPAAFGPGQCARTRCADFTILLDHRSAGIDVYVDVSLASAFWAWIEDAVHPWQHSN
jgi:heterotetrameric sarcosine oxidase gamma subunit